VNTCSINFLNSFNYHQIYAMIYIYIYTKQNKSNLTITQNTQLQSQNQGKIYIYTNHHKSTNKGSKPINPLKKKKKNYNLSNNTYHKIHKSNQRAKEKKNCIFYTQTTIKAQGVKKISSATSPIVGEVGSEEFK
jgi:hypothetical protein